ncbi:SLATT domain-containing protein [uncultured Flavobacterium sp.]|uniref:SLATT domain-containing protein n=1 Tax=uncultured Flavobacterium sp. TaxID=165435 RepID=UPI0030C892D8
MPFILLIVAILTGYQSFIKPGEKAETHRKIGIEYEKIRHEIEKVLTNFNQIQNIEESISNIKSNWDSLSTLYVSESKYTEAKEKVKSFKKYPKELGFLPDRE